MIVGTTVVVGVEVIGSLVDGGGFVMSCIAMTEEMFPGKSSLYTGVD